MLSFVPKYCIQDLALMGQNSLHNEFVLSHLLRLDVCVRDGAHSGGAKNSERERLRPTGPPKKIFGSFSGKYSAGRLMKGLHISDKQLVSLATL